MTAPAWPLALDRGRARAIRWLKLLDMHGFLSADRRPSLYQVMHRGVERLVVWMVSAECQPPWWGSTNLPVWQRRGDGIESRIAAESIKERINRQFQHQAATFVERLAERFDRAVDITQARVCSRDVHCGNEPIAAPIPW